MAVDSSKWLHKTEARTDNYLRFSSNMWHDAPRRGSKQWFLGQESKLEKETVPKRTKRRNRLQMKGLQRLPAVRA